MKILNVIFRCLFWSSIAVFTVLFVVHKILTLFWYVGGPADIGEYAIDFLPLTLIFYVVFLYRFGLQPKNHAERKFGWLVSVILVGSSVISGNAAGSTTLFSYGPLLAIMYWIRMSERRMAFVKQVADQMLRVRYVFIGLFFAYTVFTVLSLIDRQQQLYNTVSTHQVVNTFYGQQFSSLEAQLGPPTARHKPSDLYFFYKPNITYYTYCQSTLITRADRCEGVKVYVDETDKIVAAAGTGPFIHILQDSTPSAEVLADIQKKTDKYRFNYWWLRLDYLVWSTHVFAGVMPPPLYDRVGW